MTDQNGGIIRTPLKCPKCGTGMLFVAPPSCDADPFPKDELACPGCNSGEERAIETCEHIDSKAAARLKAKVFICDFCRGKAEGIRTGQSRRLDKRILDEYLDEARRQYERGRDNILEAMQRVYAQRRKHRATCNLWIEHKLCKDCGFGLQLFIEDVESEALKGKSRSERKRPQ